jgi:thioredoxin reductase
MIYDVVIAGGGPAGLAAALAFGRSRRRALLCDAGPRRNAAAERMHNFVTRDGTPPDEFRRVARAQLGEYASVEARDARVDDIGGEAGAFEVRLAGGDVVRARRVLLCLGMIDEVPSMPGYRELWGKAIVQCPYCHGWEARDGAFGYLAPSPQWLEWAIFLRSWTSDVVALTGGHFQAPPEARERLAAAGVRLEERPVRRLVPREDGERLEAIEFDDGTRLARDFLFARPPQRQTELVRRLGLDLDEQGFVRVGDQMETSRPGVYAAGDLTTMRQAAIFAASAGTVAAAMITHPLVAELAAGGLLP